MFHDFHHDEIKVVTFLTIFYHFCAIVNRSREKKGPEIFFRLREGRVIKIYVVPLVKHKNDTMHTKPASDVSWKLFSR